MWPNWVWGMAAGRQVVIGDYEPTIAAAATAARSRRGKFALHQACGLRISFAIG
jgi:hypothetical protein